MCSARSILTLILAAATVLPVAAGGGSGLPMGAVAAGAVIDWNAVRQRIDGFGASSYATLDPDALIKQADLLFNKDTGIGLSLMRMGTPWAPDTGGRPYKDPQVAQAAQARGAIVWASSWYPPPQWKSNGTAMNGGYLLPQYYGNFAALIADFVPQMKSQYGIDIHAVSIQNEPDFAGPWGTATWTADQFHAFLPFLATAFSQRGVTSKIILPEQSHWVFDLADKTMQDPTMAKHIGIIAGHTYRRPNGWTSPYAGVRPVWQTEISSSADETDFSMANALQYAFQIHQMMTQSEVNAWHYWNLGVLMKMNAKRLYAIGNYSKFIRPGYVRIGVSGDSTASAYKNPSTGEFAVVVVNTSSSAGTRTYDLSGFNAASVTPWVTAATLNLARQAAIPVSGGSFTATVAAQSVTTFVGTAGDSLKPPTAPTNVHIIR